MSTAEDLLAQNKKALIDNVLVKLSKENLTSICEKNQIKYPKGNKKTLAASVIADKVGSKVSKVFVDKLVNAEDAKDVIKTLVESVKGAQETDSKSTLQAELRKIIKDKGVEELLDKAKQDDLQSVCTALGFESGDDSNKDDIIDDIVEETFIEAARVIVGKLKSEDLKPLLKTLDLKSGPTKANTMDRILALAFPVLKDAQNVETKKKTKTEADADLKATRKPIAKGIGAEELYNSYYPKELHDFCKKNDLAVSGKKTEVIKRILAFLDGDKTVQKSYQEAERKKKATERKEKRKEREEKEKAAKKKRQEESALKAQKKAEEAKSKPAGGDKKEAAKDTGKKEETKKPATTTTTTAPAPTTGKTAATTTTGKK